MALLSFIHFLFFLHSQPFCPLTLLTELEGFAGQEVPADADIILLWGVSTDLRIPHMLPVSTVR